MNIILGFVLLLMSSAGIENSFNKKGKNNSLKQVASVKTADSLFTLDIIKKENSVKINAPKQMNFSLPDSLAEIQPIKFRDFNADGKEDVLVYLGSCGSGGCMYGLFLKQYSNKYQLVYKGHIE